jgi:hypothetical protein
MSAGRWIVTPELLDHADDLGDPDGMTYFEGAGEARQLVERWKIIAIGNRPIDHMGRDLLIASHQRDSRQKIFRRLCSRPPGWVGRRTLRIPDDRRDLACRVTVVHYLHCLRLCQLYDHANDSQRCVIGRLLRCWPIGILVDWRGPGRRFQHDVCGLARLCPFCFVRRVMALYDSLHTVLRPQAQDLFVLARLKVPDELFAPSPQFALEQQCRFVRHQIGAALLEQLKQLGADGGLVAFLVGPRLSRPWYRNEMTSEPQAGFEFNLSVLGRIVRPTPELELLMRVGAPPLQTFGELDHAPLDVQYLALANRQALRFLLFGSSIGYSNHDGIENIVGAFAWPSWNLGDYGQWAPHHDATKGMRIFDRWGNWAHRVAAAASKGPHLPRERDCSKAVLRNLTSVRRDRLLSAASDAKLFGRGRVQLRDWFAAQGLTISQRDARWLAKTLASDST